MNKSPKLIVMLTYNDITVKDASSIFEACKNTKAEYFGIKEKGINKNEIKKELPRQFLFLLYIATK